MALSSSQLRVPIPAHVAIIMDGNGRWAAQRQLPRSKGHEEGAASVRAVVIACRDLGVKYLTLYAFSVENWRRPKSEINALMQLMSRFLRDRLGELHEQGIRLRVMGRMEDLSARLQRRLKNAVRETERHENGQLILALSYGGRTELAHAARLIARKARNGELDPEGIDEDVVAQHLYLPDVPDPELVIRTSGEMRLSNFLLWQAAYAELVIVPMCWPEFREAQLKEAIEVYRRRERRFGGVEAVMTSDDERT